MKLHNATICKLTIHCPCAYAVYCILNIAIIVIESKPCITQGDLQLGIRRYTYLMSISYPATSEGLLFSAVFTVVSAQP